MTHTRVQQLKLRVSGNFHFLAGQYLNIVHPVGELIPLSIATAPHRLPELTLHYQSSEAPEAALVDELLAAHEQGNSEINISGPSGDVVLENVPDHPLLMVAGGTGASQAAGFIDHLLITPPIHDVTFLFCADTDSDLYLRSWLENLDAPWLNTIFIADARRTKENQSLLWLRERAQKLGDYRIILSGSPGFVYSAAEVLTSSGVNASALESDVFSYAPRD